MSVALALPSGKRLHSYGKSPCLMGKSTISMAMFNSYVKLPEGSMFYPPMELKHQKYDGIWLIVLIHVGCLIIYKGSFAIIKNAQRFELSQVVFFTGVQPCVPEFHGNFTWIHCV